MRTVLKNNLFTNSYPENLLALKPTYIFILLVYMNFIRCTYFLFTLNEVKLLPFLGTLRLRYLILNISILKFDQIEYLWFSTMTSDLNWNLYFSYLFIKRPNKCRYRNI